MRDALVAIFTGTMLAGGVVGLAWLATRLIRRQPLIVAAPRRPPPWSFRDIVIIVCIYILLQAGLAATLDGAPAPAAAGALDIRLLLGAAVVNLLATAAAVLVLWRRAGASWDDMGLGAAVDGGRDVAIGVGAFFVVLLPVYGLQWLLTLLFPDAESHPIARLLEKNPDPLLLAACVLTAVIVAPITEEFFVRGVLQGWLESLRMQRLPPPETVSPPADEGSGGPPAEVETGAPGATEPAEVNPFASPRSAAGPPARPRVAGPPLMPGPILISSLVFALLHVGHGVAPIPLFFFALALGYVYQRTHRLLPGIVLHASLNACSLLGLWLSL